jgi:hypothetical protein
MYLERKLSHYGEWIELVATLMVIQQWMTNAMAPAFTVTD